MPKVSVIVPNYNHACYLNQRIDTVLQQTYQDFEVIILDDRSTDNSCTVINQYRSHPKVSKIVINSINSGSTFKQWKKGISEAKGEYIWISESDDFCDKTFLDKMIIHLDKKSDVGLIYCHSNLVDENSERIGEWNYTSPFLREKMNNSFYCEGPEFIKKALLYENSIPNASSVIFRRNVYDKINSFSEEFTINGDWHFYIQLLLLSNIFFLAEPLNYFRKHSNNGSSTNIKNLNNIKEYYKIGRVLGQRLKLSAEEKHNLYNFIFACWRKQTGDSFLALFSNNFQKVFSEAYKADRRIVKKILLSSFKKYKSA